MAYRNFTWDKIKDEFGVIPEYEPLFQNVVPVASSQRLLLNIEETRDMALTTEKMLSEALVFPILQEIRARNRKTIHLFSGEILNVDKKRGLNGECDFILTKSDLISLTSPIISITEAKYGEVYDVDSLAQTTAQMIGARIFNQRKNDYQTIYGACTSGREWLFLKLDENKLQIDTTLYNINNLPELLGVLQFIIDFYG